MDNSVWLILLKAFHRAAMLFLKEGVVVAVNTLEERQRQEERHGGNGRNERERVLIRT